MSEYSERQLAWMAKHETGVAGMTAVSSGTCPGCPECMERDGYDDEEAHEEAYQCGSLDASDEPSFSWHSCGICGCGLGGDRHVWHWLSVDSFKVGADGHRYATPASGINHESDACTDCVVFHANGDVPDDEYLDWLD